MEAAGKQVTLPKNTEVGANRQAHYSCQKTEVLANKWQARYPCPKAGV